MIMVLSLLALFLILINCGNVETQNYDSKKYYTIYYTVNYDGNGNTSGYPPIDTCKYERQSSFVVKSNSGGLNKNGYLFLCWNTKTDGSGDDLYENQTVEINSNLTLYAKWKKDHDFAALEVGNTWTYLETIHSSFRKDSSIRIISVVGNIGSHWFFLIKDSTYFIKLASSSLKPDTIARIECDTCIKNENSIKCNKLNDYFIDNTLIDSLIKLFNCNDSSYLYYTKKWISGYTMVNRAQYINKIGLIQLKGHTIGTNIVAYTSKILISFNNESNYLYNCLPDVMLSKRSN